MADHNQFINLDFLKQPQKHRETPPKLNRNRSQSSKISQKSYILPRLESRLSARKISGKMGKGEVQGKQRMDSQKDYQVYLYQAKYRQRFDQLNSLPILPISLSKIATNSPLDSIPQYPHSPPTKKKTVKQSNNQQTDHKIDEKKPFSLKNDKNYVREIFKEVSQAAKFKAKMRQLIQKQKSQKQLKQKRIKQYEQILGNRVYKRVANHLQATSKKKLGYDEQIKGQSKVDQALINFIKFKIKRAHTASD